MRNAFFAFVSRMRYINRWALMRNTRHESLEEHSLQVAMIAHAIAVIRAKYYPADSLGRARVEISPDRAATMAIYHDADEIIVGDMPTPVKYMNPQIESVFKNIEMQASTRLLSMLPDEIRLEYQALLLPEKDDLVVAETVKIVKAADKISALIKCMEEKKAGNSEFDPAFRKLQMIVDEIDLPEVKHFVREFLPAYGLTLDELEAD